MTAIAATPQPATAPARGRDRHRLRLALAAGAVAAVVTAAALGWILHRQGTGDLRSPEQAWRPIPAAPLSDRQAPASAWAADRLVVWGGVAPEDFYGGVGGTDGDGATLLTDGAAWTPGGEWTSIADPPSGLGLIPGGFAVAAGHEIIFGPVWPAAPAGRADAAHGPGLLAYQPAADQWREIPVTSARLVAGERYPDSIFLLQSRYRPLAVGRELVLAHRDEVVAGGGAGVLAIDLASGATRLLDPGPFGPHFEDPLSRAVHLTHAADQVLAIAGRGTQAWLLDLGSGEWHQAADPPEPGSSLYQHGLWTGDQVLFLDNLSPYAYHPGTDEWHPLRRPPKLERSHTQAGRRYLWTGEVALAAGRAYRPSDGRWLRTPPLPLEPDQFVSGYTGAWTGGSLLIFGGLHGSCPPDAHCHFEHVPVTLAGWQYHPLLPAATG